MTAIKDAVSHEHGLPLLKELMMLIKEANPSYFERVSKKEEFLFLFLKYPKEVRRSLYSTNLAESINRKIEDAKQLGGGYFHSVRNLG